MAARVLMLQGTGSSVGKSLLVAGLARALVKRGLSVRPFKPQNMSNNAAVTAEGGEIGRAQALQALAAYVEPSVHMNPVLLKPQSEIGAQVIVQGKVFGRATAREMQELKPKLMPYVLESFARLKQEADIVLVEGAGSASEINLRKNDIANMGFARAADVPVVVIGDIDRGGVIASLVGTKARARPRRCEARRRLHRQPHARRCFAVRRGHGGDRATHRLARAWARAVLRGRAAAPGGRRLRSCRAASHAQQWQSQSGGAAPAAYRQFRRSRSVGGGARRRRGHGEAGTSAPRLRSHRAAGIEVDHRRSWRAPRAKAGTSTLPRMCGAEAMCLDFAAAIRCWDGRSQIRTASRARRNRCRA